MEHRIVRTSLFLGALLVGCSEPSTTALDIEPQASAIPAPVVASATGSGHFAQGGELRTFTFAAVGRADGSASGEYHVTIHAIDAFFHATVTCMRARGDTAWVAGVIDRTNHPVIQAGTVTYFWTVDGGEDPDATDIVSVARINDALGQDQVFCGLTPDEDFSGLPGRAVEKGNVQVRTH
jgi:hypothetical protein